MFGGRAEVGLPDSIVSKGFVPLESAPYLLGAGLLNGAYAVVEVGILLNPVLVCARLFIDDDGCRLCCVVVGLFEDSGKEDC